MDEQTYYEYHPESLISDAYLYVKGLCEENNIDETHGLSHAITVKNHIKQCLISEPQFQLSNDVKVDLQLASLLHDVDDHKYFSKGSTNAIKFLKKRLRPERVDRVLRWISYVSTSQNGNEIPEEARSQPWVLWPRYGDRIEAVGEVGLARVFEYSHRHNIPDVVVTTPRPKTVSEVMNLVTSERFERYRQRGGVSDSSIDHIYDKLLHLIDVETHSQYLNQSLEKGRQYLIDACLNFSPRS
jgi:hypothetical protein